MNTLAKKLQRSKSNESINFSKFQSIGRQDPLVKAISTSKIIVEPIWTIPGDFEGGMYANYIAGHPEYDGIYLRSELLTRVNSASQYLDGPFKLVIRAGHRPIAVQKRLLKECVADYKNDNPGTSDDEALDHARTFCSDPDITLPPHVCGAAVDVEIFNTLTNEYLDFGSNMNDDNEKSFLHYSGLTKEQKDNRLILLTAMLSAGLASCKTEWWHYSYGDQIWAWFYGKENSLYDPIDIL